MVRSVGKKILFISSYFVMMMAESEDPIPSIAFHEVLPTEIIVKIFKELDRTSIYQARNVCKGWKAIIDDFQLGKSKLVQIYSFNLLPSSRTCFL